MLANLSRELQRKNITQDAVAQMLGITRKTMTNKLKGKTEFTIGEAFYINRNILPEFTVDYLFATDDDQTA
jgi:plasmid maintenance system antidote protein VapI